MSQTPALNIREFYAAASNLPVADRPAFVFGPAAQLIRYGIATEKSLGSLGGYSVAGTLIEGTYQTAYPWPGRPLGAVTDLAYTKLYADAALLRYYEHTSHTALKVARNQVRLPGLDLLPNSTSAVIDRGVQAGDVVLINGVVSATPFSLRTRVLGLTGPAVASSLGSAVAVAGNASLNAEADASVDAGEDNSGEVTATGAATNYVGVTSGYMTEVYTVTVIQASTGGNATTARLRVTSASGTDDVASATPAAFGAATTIGSRGATMTFTDVDDGDFALGDTWVLTVAGAYTLPVPVVTGTYTGTTPRTYIVEVVQGEKRTDGPKIRCVTQEGDDSSGPTTLAVDGGTGLAAVAVGNYGAQLSFSAAVSGLRLGDRWTIAATPAGIGQKNTLVLAHALPDDVALNSVDHDLEIQLCAQRDIVIPARSETPGAYNFTSHPTELRVLAGITLTDASLTRSSVPVTLTLLNDALGDSKLYVETRYWLAAGSAIATVSDDTSRDVIAPGATHPDNPLRQALVKMMGASGGAAIRAYRIGDPSVEANWTAALRLAEQTAALHGMVPLTDDPTIQSLVAAHVESLSDPSRDMRRCAWLSLTPQLTTTVVSAATSTDDAVVLATIADDPETSGTQYTLLTITSDNVDLLTAGVRPGDTVRFGYSADGWGVETYLTGTVDAVLSADALRLAATGIQEVVPRRIEIHRQATTTDLVAQLQAAAAPFGRRTRLVLTGLAYDGVNYLPGYYTAGIVAAMSAAVLPHQPLSNFAINGLVSVPFVKQFTDVELDEIASAGVLIIAEDTADATVFIRHAITAGDYDSDDEREESAQRNIDSILSQIRAIAKPFLTGRNATEAVAGQLKAEMDSLAIQLRNGAATPNLGGQLIDADDAFVYRVVPRVSPILKNRIVTSITLRIPGPLNGLDIDVYFG